MQGWCQNGGFVSCWLTVDYETVSCGWGSWKSVKAPNFRCSGAFFSSSARVRAWVNEPVA